MTTTDHADRASNGLVYQAPAAYAAFDRTQLELLAQRQAGRAETASTT